MKNKILILVLALMAGFLAIQAEVDPLAIESKHVPSETYLSANKRSIGADINVQTISSTTRGINTRAQIEHGGMGWGANNPFLPGGQGWDISGGTGNVGYPVGDVSFPILLSMLLLYFLYRGVSSSKRKSNF